MNLRKIAALVASGALALSMIGAGVGATFTKTSAANDTITVADLAIQAYTSNNNVNFGVNGCSITVTASSGFQMCYVRVDKSGDIVPSNLQIVATVSSGSIPEANLWTVTDYLSSTGTINNSNPPTWNYANPSFSWVAPYKVTWAGLGNTSLNTTFVLTFTATATA